jgi:hypothetical protein
MRTGCLKLALSVASRHRSTAGHSPESVQSGNFLFLGNVVKKSLFIKTAVALALAAPLLASAESELTIGTGAADARLNFRVVIPQVLFLAVGPGANNAGDPLVISSGQGTATFDYSGNAAAVGTGAAASAISGAAVPVRVVGNNGPINLTASTTGALSNGTGDFISWSEITATSSAPELPSPVIVDGATGAPAPVSVSLGKITDRAATWTFSYANSSVVAPGTYGTTNGAVTYTATMP